METTHSIKSSPRDFFLHLLSNIALYYCAVWLITLWWQFINQWYPEVGYYNYENSWIPSAMRWAIASLVIVFPVYIAITRILNKDLDAHPAKREYKVRKWLMYLTLTLAAVTIVIDLIALLFNLLEGDFAVAFILRVTAVLIVAALIFGYYWYELRRDGGTPASRRGLFRAVAIVLVAASVIGAFFVVGSPAQARMRRNDQQRITDLQSIQGQVVYYYQRKTVLPSKLGDLNDAISGFTVPVDPDGVSGKDYEYRALSATSFELCASFSSAANSAAGRTDPSLTMPIKPYGISENWTHEAGRTCFTRTIDPQLYPPLPR